MIDTVQYTSQACLSQIVLSAACRLTCRLWLSIGSMARLPNVFSQAGKLRLHSSWGRLVVIPDKYYLHHSHLSI